MKAISSLCLLLSAVSAVSCTTPIPSAEAPASMAGCILSLDYSKSTHDGCTPFFQQEVFNVEFSGPDFSQSYGHVWQYTRTSSTTAKLTRFHMFEEGTLHLVFDSPTTGTATDVSVSESGTCRFSNICFRIKKAADAHVE